MEIGLHLVSRVRIKKIVLFYVGTIFVRVF